MPPDETTIRTWVTQFRKGVIELAVLNMLAAGESYGYALARQCAEIPGLAIKEGTLYLLLNRLSDAGLLKQRTERTSRLRKRTYFSLSAKGRRRLDEMNRHYDAMAEQLALLRR
jgi:PadR family transcriptional regulator, regulatory protein PadR